jgi:putative ABC transport system ATP-binding protein
MVFAFTVQGVASIMNDKIKTRDKVISNSQIVTCRHVSKAVNSTEGPISILENIDLEVNAAETIAVVGQSGSGKTTLLSLLAGLDIPTSGSIQLFQHPMDTLDEDARAELRNQYIGFVFQAFHLLPGFTALENVMLPLEINDNIDAETIAKQLLERVGMDHRLGHYPTTLSGGEQQRVAIARAFATTPPLLLADEPTGATTPPLLLADEPTGNLDTETGQKVIDLLFELNQEQGTTLILVTHDESLTKRCDRCFQLTQGKLELI